MKSLWLGALEWSCQPSFLLDRPHVPGLTPGLAFRLVPLWLGPGFSLSNLLSPPTAWKSAHKPEWSVWSLLTADTHFIPSLLMTFPSATCSHTAPSLNLPPLQCPLFAWVLACHLATLFCIPSRVWPARLDFLEFLPQTVCRSRLCRCGQPSHF